MSPLNCQCTKSLMAPSFSLHSFSKCVSSHLVLFLQILPSGLPSPTPPQKTHFLIYLLLTLPSLTLSRRHVSHLDPSDLPRFLGTWNPGAPLAFGHWEPPLGTWRSLSQCAWCDPDTVKLRQTRKNWRRIQLTTWIKPRSLRSPGIFELVEGIELGCLKKTLLKQCYVVVNHFVSQ